MSLLCNFTLPRDTLKYSLSISVLMKLSKVNLEGLLDFEAYEMSLASME